jgi:hypothetical protein
MQPPGAKLDTHLAPASYAQERKADQYFEQAGQQQQSAKSAS